MNRNSSGGRSWDTGGRCRRWRLGWMRTCSWSKSEPGTTQTWRRRAHMNRVPEAELSFQPWLKRNPSCSCWWSLAVLYYVWSCLFVLVGALLPSFPLQCFLLRGYQWRNSMEDEDKEGWGGGNWWGGRTGVYYKEMVGLGSGLVRYSTKVCIFKRSWYLSDITLETILHFNIINRKNL